MLDPMLDPNFKSAVEFFLLQVKNKQPYIKAVGLLIKRHKFDMAKKVENYCWKNKLIK